MAKVTAQLIREVKDETARVVSSGTTEDWDGASTEVLLEAVDSSLTVALEKLPEAIN